MENRPLVVVVVDDEDSVLRLVRRSLAPCGCEVHDAAEGWGGLKTIEEVKPDVVILDVRLPRIQGYELCRRIKKSVEGRDAKVLMISGLMGEGDKEWARLCGADETLQKPFDRDELVRKVVAMTGAGAKQ